ncbi:tetraspanin-10 isoform X2 [Henckelia pumila]|uniref:tetraspanin-10 isoform X2 n=1 Tax=Henckelia pumila TaxID=405737 RepID=UPI003C6E5367
MSSGMGTSTFIIKWINFLTMLLAVGVIGFGVWMSTHHDSCKRSLTLPVIILGAVILVVSIIGFFGALKKNSILLWIYLILLCIILLAILVFTVLAFIVTNNGSGHTVAGLRYKEYQLQDYSSWFLKRLNNSHNWDHLKSCLVKSNDCNDLSKKYKTLKQFKSAKLSPIEAGCCRPPSECGYPVVNASFYDLSFHPISSIKDCKLYKNSKNIKCYNCDSCKAGVAQYMKTEWRVVAIFNVILFVVLSMVYLVGCCARRNAAKNHSKRKDIAWY